jgi:hypothetical protein
MFRKNPNGKDRQRTCTNIHSRLRRGYFVNAHNAGGNHRRCILVRYSSPGTCAQMTPVAAVIAGQNTGTASALELELPVKTGVSTTHKSSVAVKALSQDDIESRYQPRLRESILLYYQFVIQQSIRTMCATPYTGGYAGGRSQPELSGAEYHVAVEKPCILSSKARERGNPNSGKPAPHAPYVATAFEEQVRKFGLTEQTCVASEELRRWCEHNKDRCYIPEWLLKRWQISVDPNVSG